MRTQTLAHLSDLHLGRSPESDAVAARIRDAASEADHIVVTGDITHRGHNHELRRFYELFGGLIADGRLTVVPGNHDRLGDDVGARLMRDRVEVVTAPGLYLVCVDSTGPHNKFLLAGHGDLCDRVLDDIAEALLWAPRHHLVAVLLHHHPLQQDEETFPERLSTRLGWPWAQELRLGHALIGRVQERADLILHGHRHQPRAVSLDLERPLGIYNAGCTTQLARFRQFSHLDGVLAGEPIWLDAVPPEVGALRPTGTE